jgi:hypothetical protein
VQVAVLICLSGEVQVAVLICLSGEVQVAVLIWTHTVIGWGFFVLQSWIPTYLNSMGTGSLADGMGAAGLRVM